MKPGQRLVLSDETFVDQPAIYNTPAMMPAAVIAQRLRDLFGSSEILFTIRNQERVVVSNYLSLRRNCAKEGRPLEPFGEWFAGNLVHVRNLYLRNLDASHAIKIYERVFGSDAVHVLPLEILTRCGADAYLRRASEIAGIESGPGDAERYYALNASPPHGIVLTDDVRDIIARRAAHGNAYVAARFALPLGELGYPMPSCCQKVSR
jgi:hypothetical protein